MKSIKHFLLIATISLGSFSFTLDSLEEKPPMAKFEWRLQEINSNTQLTERLHHLFDLYWEWKMVSNPVDATFCGYPGLNHLWPDLSLEAISQRHLFASQLLNVLKGINSDPLMPEDRISYLLLKRDVEEEIEEFSYKEQYLLVNQMHGIHLLVPMIIELMPSKTIEDYENIIARLLGLKDLFDQIIVLLDKGLENEMTPPKVALTHVPQQILNQIADDPFESPLLSAFKTFPTYIASEEQERLRLEASEAYSSSVRPSLSALSSYLMDRYIPNSRTSIGLTDLPNGQDWYSYKIRHFTTTNLSAEEIHEIGIREVKRIYQEMLKVIASTSFNGSFHEFLHFLKTDSQFFYSDRADLLKGYQDLTQYIESQLPKLFTKLPKLPYKVLPIPAYAEESQITAYYCQGSSVDQRPGCFFINTSFPETRPKWEMEPLALHEAVPGHHLQITLAQEIADIPEFRRHCGYTAYIEGWGLYAESLGEELGLYRNPYSQFGRLTYEMLRAIRLVVDTGMHAKGWSRQDAIEFFKDYVGLNEHEIKTEVDRYLAMPGQALAYKIGELKIKELKQLAQEELGDLFDIRIFHEEWLKHGALPLEITEDLIRQWIDLEPV